MLRSVAMAKNSKPKVKVEVKTSIKDLKGIVKVEASKPEPKKAFTMAGPKKKD